MKVAESVTDLVGGTPLVALDAVGANVYGKVESFNPNGSIKDRIALAMIERAEARGEITAETTVVEPTSGNTGIGLASTCAAKDYDLVLTMPASMSEERRAMLQALGARLVLTPADEGMNGAIDRAEAILENADDAYMPQQFQNPANPAIHRETTGPEIQAATDGEVDVVVAGVGTGGTITGIARYFDEDAPNDVTMVAVEPAASAVISGGEPGSHGIEGIGAGFVPDILDVDRLDDIVQVTDEDAKAAARELAAEAGILVGISSGAAVHAASVLQSRAAYEDDTIVVVLPDTGERYLSTDLFASET
ncbi:cysteine synthase A [Halanaeroarchaeum sulfurireducens]|uniref:Cysteine synthase n=1 Tax=Halanaeroarchaeum sulfurireducens TaxID=1604004 RepID=A0A0F7PAL6_9EURY|nr:cysteine synthase A [Halanaeroarchaeum sulfurireducens]AKH97777.1 cysteine synthase [Halanaeroarchaeum sulfurireducens]ALG82172.1 cysteine synthase [Halanaeroarchaeum sulfurireducens]